MFSSSIRRQASSSIYCYGGAAINLYGGKVTNGYATLRGGNIDLREYNEKKPALLIGENAVMSGGIAESTGGNIYAVGATITVKGVVENGEAKLPDGTLANGGNIYATVGAAVEVDGTVRGGKAAVGGNIFLEQSELTVKGKVEGGDAQNGANIYTKAKTEQPAAVTVVGGTITGDVVIGADTAVTLSGKVQISKGELTGLNLTKEGTLIDITELTADSSVSIYAQGVFTTEREDIADLAFLIPLFGF